MSVTLAPRARISVNAAWPGVSRKTMSRPLIVTWYAPMCCVIRRPRARRPASCGSRREARLAVIDVAHHRDDGRAQDHVFGARFAFVGLQQLFFEALHLHVGAELARDHVAVSVSSAELIVSIRRFMSSLARTSFTRRSSLSARSFTVMPSASVMVLVTGGGADAAGGGAGRACSRR
jgi:hypothetical protein